MSTCYRRGTTSGPGLVDLVRPGAVDATECRSAAGTGRHAYHSETTGRNTGRNLTVRREPKRPTCDSE